MRWIARAEGILLEVPLTRTFYGGTYSMNRRCTLLLRVWTAEGVRGQIYIGDERDEQAVVCRLLFEEPVHWYDQIRGMREVRAATGMRVTAGQSEMQRWGCRDLVEGGAVDILNTDVSLTGGVTEWRRVAAHASSHRVQMAHHEEPLLSMHLLASTPQGLYPEYFSPERDPVGAYLPTMAPPLQQGWVELPETPGFGIEVDEAFVQRYRVER